jgi:hypothetical protein
MCSDMTKSQTQEHHELVDDQYFQVLIRLRKMGLLQKEDIQRCYLLHECCHQLCYLPVIHYFPVKKGINIMFSKSDCDDTPFHDVVKLYIYIYIYIPVQQ